ncbi:MAG: efflux RND transporter periplasmic adaptor subunit [Brevundimonas sp.]|jgi:cobalt-zinc-cadmium efflux system membrane fusion protein|uniref:efflux RND transporter periplasmic adaptor subunit n=1 Tax=Brevundimonas TaxID=41275 RepID=UPI0008CB81B6|nr:MULTISPECIES: HlyD family efflux transporter periplasmic adaptor subunit [Brevundimonas]MBD3837114.1 efflux RND transporter periplasmic adaptor subunit [Brevundimonas sp.]MBU2396323.1 efflux RND transporter periplasmic adaptor subunit [Alphaproteobacteria bacterium]OGN51939.1 MAG: cation transporter [Caulobacterales bacterium RIFOXYB1_FULL_67_16]OYX36605.1 MAG: HlyD family secretion protein [Caulobacterales bacterium 32-69-10]
MTRTHALRLASGAALTSLALVLAACGGGGERAEKAEGAEAAAAGDYERGPNNGRLLRDGDFSLEVTIYEEGPEPLFRIYPYLNDKPLDPRQVQLTMALTRLGPQVDRFTFTPEGAYLASPGVVTEPHSFDVAVNAVRGGKTSRWTYQSYEGRTQITAEAARAGGVTTEQVGPATLAEALPLTGRVELAPEAQAEVHARYPGRVVSLNVQLGQRVSRGQVVARVESSESLQTYSVTAPISGVITAKNINPGAITGNGTPMLMIGDPTRLHAEFFLYPRDAERVRVGQRVQVRSTAGENTTTGTIEAILPADDVLSQTLVAHVALPAQGGVWRPGLGVDGTVQVGTGEVPLAVRTRALQPFRDFTVVYAKVGNTYEVRMLELGRRTDEWTEVLGGIDPNTTYVVDGAFLIRADIDKSGASHDH